jgi:hypothetical protein
LAICRLPSPFPRPLKSFRFGRNRKGNVNPNPSTDGRIITLLKSDRQGNFPGTLNNPSSQLALITLESRILKPRGRDLDEPFLQDFVHVWHRVAIS